ncbi:hypothetical protein GCM10023096_32690 [Nonomuraea ferruginea]
MPTPVTSRSSPSWTALPARADSSMPDDDTARQARISGRRPVRSATGARNSDPSAIPTSPALSSRPSSVPDSRHSAETAAAVNDMTSTSNPSTTFSRTHTATADHCDRDIGASSMRARRRAGDGLIPAQPWVKPSRRAFTGGSGVQLMPASMAPAQWTSAGRARSLNG